MMSGDEPRGDSGDDRRRRWFRGACHCAGVRFRVELTGDVLITLCNCSICSMSGHQELMVTEDRVRVDSGEELLTTYQYGTRVSRHTFCSVCGIKPFYRPRSHPTGYYSVNARCVDLDSVTSISYVEFDGRHWEASIAAGDHRVTE